MRPMVDRMGQRYGRLVVVGRGEDYVYAGGRRVRWVCRCDCGAECLVQASNLAKGAAQSCGCLKREGAAARGKLNRREEVAYRSAHDRVRRERGKAKYHACSDCGGVASEWSYDGTDPDELTEDVRHRDGALRPVAFSLKPEHYSPRCRSCHIKFDKARVKEAQHV